MAWLLDAMQQAAEGDWQGATDTASQGVSDTVDAATEAAAEAVGSTAESVAGGFGLGTGTGKGGGDLVDEIFGALDDATGGRISRAGDHMTAAGEFAGETVEQIGNTARDATEWAGNTATEAAEQIVNTAQDATEWAGNTATEAAEQIVNTAQDATEWAGNKAQDATEWAGNTATEAAEQIVNTAQDLAEIGDTVITAPMDHVDQVTGGKLSEGVASLGRAARAVADGDLDRAAEEGAAAAESLRQGATNGVRAVDRLTGGRLSEEVVDAPTPGELMDAVTRNGDAWDAYRAGLDDLRSAADMALEGDFSGAIAVATGAGDAIDTAVDELGGVGHHLVEAADAVTPVRAGEAIADLIDAAGQQAETAAAAAEDDPATAAAAAAGAADAYTGVTARIGLATAATVDRASDGALANAAVGIERAEAELADGRYDDALAELDDVAVDLGRVATVVSAELDVERLPERLAEAREVDPVRAEGHERLGAVVDAVARRLPVASRTSSDPQEGGEAAPGTSGGVVSPGSSMLDALTDGHLAEAAAAIRRAASVDVDPDEVADAVKEATDHLRATGPATASSVVAMLDQGTGGHLGDTAGLATRAARAVREGDYDEAAAIGPRLAERHAVTMSEVDVGGTVDDLTEGHADAAVRHLDEATILEALGDPDAAVARTAQAADEYDAAVASYDSHVERVVTEGAGLDAAEPVRERMASALDSAAGGELSRARASLERGAGDARSGDVAGAVAAGREATGAFEAARAVYLRPDAPARLANEVRQAVDEAEPPMEASDVGLGASDDVVVDTAPLDLGPDLDFDFDEVAADVATVDADRPEYEPALDAEPALLGYDEPEPVADAALSEVGVDGIDAMADVDALESTLDLD